MQLSLEIEARTDADDLTVSYRLENPGDRRVFAYLRALDGAQEAHPELAYTCLLRDSSTLHLLLAPPPPGSGGVMLFQPVAPLARALGPGETVEGRLVFPLPVEEWQPLAEVNTAALLAEFDSGGAIDWAGFHREVRARFYRETEARQVRLTIGFAEEEEVESLDPVEASPGESSPVSGEWWRIAPEGRHRVSATAVLPSPVGILARTDDYPTF